VHYFAYLEHSLVWLNSPATVTNHCELPKMSTRLFGPKPERNGAHNELWPTKWPLWRMLENWENLENLDNWRNDATK